MIHSGHKFAHGTAAELPWHVKNICDLKMIMIFNIWASQIITKLEICDLIMIVIFNIGASQIPTKLE